MSNYHDPYDIWSTPVLGKLKYNWSSGSILSKLVIPFIGVAEVFFPTTLRNLFGVKKHCFPHVEALESSYLPFSDKQFIDRMFSSRINNSGWGLPFGWYSKNGVYDNTTPYITNTPYVMEALLSCVSRQVEKERAICLFNDTWQFLESLHVKFQTDDCLALSYAPLDEPRIVTNANSYAALAYALHAVHGRHEIREIAAKRSRMITNWLLSQQNYDGSWYYYADDYRGNFIDCFHSCFIVKNLIKVEKLLPVEEVPLFYSATKGLEYIRNQFFKSDLGLCSRFSVREHKDPFRFELYDQAEYLGLLIDFDMFEDASKLVKKIENTFKIGEDWYCRIDIFGRRWGRNFMRWGIVPFLYHKARLDRKLTEAASLCAE